MSPSKCTCIIPFYNEDPYKLKRLLKSLLEVKNIDQIICVDDGSSDKRAAELISKDFKKIKLIVLPKNAGKSDAVKRGLSEVKTEYLLLMDADLSYVIPSEIEQAIKTIIDTPELSMLILRRISDPWYSRLIRGEILTSGERILKAYDLERVFSEHKPNRYQLEFAINFYMMKHKKKAMWFSYSGRNNPKIEKFGFLNGVRKEIFMYKEMLSYAGVVLPIKSLFAFCTRGIKT